MKVYVFDLDGTLANLDHRLHFVRDGNNRWDEFYKACVDDTPIQWVVDLYRMVWAHCEELNEPVMLVILSGRSDAVRDETEKWLRKHQIYYDRLIMRPDKDYTPDNKLKLKMMNDLLEEYPSVEVEFIVDDRQQVVDMWRENGYNVLQCNAWKED